MKYKIIWSKIATEKHKEILKYLQSNWGHKESKKYTIFIKNALETISLNPYIGTVYENKKEFRKILILRKINIFYTISKDSIIIHSLWEAKRNPLQVNKLLF